MGKISCNINKWVLYASDTKGTDNLALTTVEYNYPIGKKLNIGAHLAELRRTKAGKFTVEKSVTLGKLEEIVTENKLAEVLISSGRSGVRFVALFR